YVCNKTYLSVRSDSWIGPNGMPFDHQMNRRFSQKIMSHFPLRFISWYIETFFLNKRFDHKLYGIKPNFNCFSQVPVSDQLLNRLISGRVIVKKNVESFVENGVIFE
ncbi:unnamed protein product, partial [Sphagnum compactum]